MLQRHLRRAEMLARTIYGRDHSNGGDEDHEDPHNWLQAFYDLFQAGENDKSPSQRAANMLVQAK